MICDFNKVVDNLKMSQNNSVFVSSLIAGGAAGLTVDISLFPLDTIKTRLQAPQGFLQAGGFKGIYKGLGPQAVGSAPTAALFFCTYELFKLFATPVVPSYYAPIVHMTAASLGEVVACIVRVPVEVVKQRHQTSIGQTSISILIQTYRSEGIFKGLYRGFGSTVLREIPFSFIQFPLYEYFKVLASRLFCDGAQVPSYQVAICGALAGGIAAASTTPLDVAKTRIMLAKKKLPVNVTLRIICEETGLRGLYAGIVPRVLMITFGGAIFFGAYDVSKNFVNTIILQDQGARC